MTKYHPVVVFVSAEQTGNGNPQTVAHGLGITPNMIYIQTASTTDSWSLGTVDDHVVTVTVASGHAYYVIAFKHAF